MQQDKVYIYGLNTKDTKQVYFKYLGYSLGGNKCFHIWNDTNNKPALVTFSDTWINKNLKQWTTK